MSEFYDEQPEPCEPITTECIYCGGTFEVSDYKWVANYDCGGCRLDDEQMPRYIVGGHVFNPEMAGRE